MITVALGVRTDSLGRRIGRALAAVGWRVVRTSELRAAPPVSADVALVESCELTEGRLMDEIPPGARLIAVVNGASDGIWGSTAQARVVGVVDRDDPDDGLVAAVEAVADGRGWISPELATWVLSGGPGRAPRPCVASPLPEPAGGRTGLLTARESDVAALVGQGLSNSEIAARLCVELSTVKFHVSNVLRKLECRDRAQLAVVVHTNRAMAA
ncbi:response regulator transcription factor [Streptomyces roseolus]|uniref:helix-turn-helix transcriptional regulator n=1 Tax=Streptomyces roseolus TaxID=67358 RepID=UPI0036FF5051